MDSARSAVATLGAEERRTLLDVARSAIVEHLRDGSWPHPTTDFPALREPRAAFVTLRDRRSGALRGCRGEVRAHQPLIDSVAQMAIASATDDPRFPPVLLAEVPNLHIEISALTPLARIAPEDVEVGRHGLMIIHPRGSGLLLPEVPVRFGWDRDAFLAATCEKAGLPPDAWRDPGAELYGFEAEVWGEPE